SHLSLRHPPRITPAPYTTLFRSRMVIAAAKKYGVRGVGVDLDPARIREAQANAKEAGVEELVTFKVADMFETDVTEATVVLLYLDRKSTRLNSSHVKSAYAVFCL